MLSRSPVSGQPNELATASCRCTVISANSTHCASGQNSFDCCEGRDFHTYFVLRHNDVVMLPAWSTDSHCLPTPRVRAVEILSGIVGKIDQLLIPQVQGGFHLAKCTLVRLAELRAPTIGQ